MALFNIFLLLFFSFCFVSVHSYEYVPVYMWETSKSYSPLPALGRINEEFFRDILLDKLNKNKVVLVFSEENLSPEDFTSYDSAGNSVFYALSHIKSEAQVNYYPFVEAPLKSLQSLPGVRVSRVSVTNEGLPENANIKPGQVLIIDLNDAKESEDRSHMLSRHDSLIMSIYKSVATKHENVLALFTAQHSSWLVPSELEGNSRRARHLLETAEEGKNNSWTFKNATSFMMYLSRNPEIRKQGKIESTIDVSAATLSTESTENENGTVLTATLSSTQGSFSFMFLNSQGYWFWKELTINTRDVDATFKLKAFAPLTFSYSCNFSTFTVNDTEFVLPGLQFQPFKNESTFDDAYNCVGFTTAPIWSGLFVTFILAMIMTIGLCMIMDIKTMDRFDDPKGKTISINVSE